MVKNIFIGLTIAFMSIGYTENAQSSNACEYPKSSQKTPELVIYYANNRLSTYPINKVDEALEFYFSKKQAEQPLLLYVHGRALGDTKIGDYDHEPNESKTDAYPTLSNNSKTILMLHWPHKQVENDFPEADARFSGNALVCVIQQLNSDTFNANNYPGFRALITHSMGAIVLEEALKTHSEINLSEFDAVAIFAAASRASDANLWLPKIKARNTYVFINNHDVVLRVASNKINNAALLGICDLDCFKNNPPIQSITYLDISDIAGMLLNARHNYFVKGKVAEKIVPKIFKGEPLPHGIDIDGAPKNVRKIRDQDIK